MTVLSGAGFLIQGPLREVPQCTTYKGVTPTFGIPVLSGIGTPGGPITLSEYCELKAANIINNHLTGAIEGHVGDGYFTLGDFTIDEEVGKVYNDDFRAFINDIYVENLLSQPATWSVSDFSTNPYLFVSIIEEVNEGFSNYKSSLEFGEFSTRVSNSFVPLSDDEIIIGRVISGNGAISVTKSVPDVRKFTEIEDHIFNDNPHGNVWNQDSIVASGVGTFECAEILDTNVTTSGIFNTLPRAPGTFAPFQDFIAFSGIQIIGDYTSRTNMISDQDLGLDVFQARGYNFIDTFEVYSGIDIWGESIVESSWTFNDETINGRSGISIFPVSGVEWPISSVNGRRYEAFDPSMYGAVLDNHLTLVNPHRLVASGINGVGILSAFGDTLTGNLNVDSGISIDGVDISEFTRLLDGSIVTAADHTHLLLQPIEYQFFQAPYQGMVASGIQPGALEETYDFQNDRTMMSWYSYSGIAAVKLFIRGAVPVGARELSGIDIITRVGFKSGVGPLNRVDLSLYDTNGVLASAWTDSVNVTNGIAASSENIFEENQFFRMEVDMQSDTGMEASVSDIVLRWKT